MKAAIVTIGDEILIGQITDTNSGYIAKALDRIGIQTHEMLSISDDKNHILNTFTSLQDEVDIVIITGGLGPTKDDITKKTFCTYFDDHLISNEKVLAHVTEIIEGFFKRKITQLNIDQSLVPSKCEVLFNKVGTAPGMWIKKSNTLFISLPGVPFEVKYLMENEVIPKLMTTYERPFIVHKTIITYGMGESMVAERLETWENNLPEFIKLAYLPNPGRVRLRLTARGTNKQILEDEIARNVKSLVEIIGDIVVGFEEDETIEVILSRLLTQKNKTIAIAESCTVGKIASNLASISGASAYFKGSLITYSTAAKVLILGVSQSTIDSESVVSAAVAQEMALGIQRLYTSDYALATTGNAGPTSGETTAKLGTVFIAIATPTSVFVEEHNFGQPREKVIDRATNKAFEMLLKELSKKI